MNYNFLTLSVLMHINPTIHYNTGHNKKSIHIIIQELMYLLHGNTFFPGMISSLTLSVLMSSVLTNYVHVHIRISVQVLVVAHAVEQ